VSVRTAGPEDVDALLGMIRQLAEFEKLTAEVSATRDLLQRNLFEHRYAEAVVADVGGSPAGMALFFHSFSTFLGRPGIYLEDLFVLPEHRGKGIGRTLLRRLAQIALERG